jgi:hypothetical protein
MRVSYKPSSSTTNDHRLKNPFYPSRNHSFTERPLALQSLSLSIAPGNEDPASTALADTGVHSATPGLVASSTSSQNMPMRQTTPLASETMTSAVPLPPSRYRTALNRQTPLAATPHLPLLVISVGACDMSMRARIQDSRSFANLWRKHDAKTLSQQPPTVESGCSISRS